MIRLRSEHVATQALAVLAVVSMALAGYFFVTGRTFTYDPLGTYATQRVTSGSTLPDGSIAVNLGDLIAVRGTKCNDSDNPVDVRGVLSWQAIDPPGANIEIGRGASVLDPGCTTRMFLNPIPADVRHAIEIQHANGIAQPVWRVTGTETPISPDGIEGVSRTWVTDNFTVLP